MLHISENFLFGYVWKNKKQAAVCLLARTLGNPSNLFDWSRWIRTNFPLEAGDDAHVVKKKKKKGLSGARIQMAGCSGRRPRRQRGRRTKDGQIIRPSIATGLQTFHLHEIIRLFSRASVSRGIGREFKSRREKIPKIPMYWEGVRL